jgi:predicted unusual protein kinase regulating ubiquinone biosynthesis (AarF/ABC1/UbiB family)
MSTQNHHSISDARGASGGPPTRPATRVAMVLRLFLGLLLEFWWLSLSARLENPEAFRNRADQSFRRQAVRLRHTAEQMGGLIVKVGQFLSSRVDLLPPAFVGELQELQDHVQASPWEEVRAVIERELGPVDSVFASWDPEPLASASLGQVYQARSWADEALAVKVQRPHIARIVQADLAALQLVVAITSRITRFGRTFDLGALLDEFRHTVAQELDYQQEAAHARRIAQECAEFPWLVVPRVHEDLSTRAVLTMDLYHGFKITDRSAFQAAQVDPRETAERLIHLYLHMVMDTGFFHADPHPGNFLLAPDGRIVLLDYGMVGEIATATRRQMRLLFVGVSERRPSVVVDSLYALAIVRPEANRRDLRQRVAYLLNRYYAETLQEMRQLDVESLIRDLEALIREEPIQFPAHFAFLGRAISMLVGLATGLDPDVNIIQLFTPYARRFVTGDAGGTAQYVARRAQEWVSSLGTLPPLIARVLRQIEDGDIEAAVRWVRGEEELRGLRRSLGSLSTAAWTLGLLVLGVWTRRLGWTLASDAAFALAGVEWIWHWRRRP